MNKWTNLALRLGLKIAILFVAALVTLIVSRVLHFQNTGRYAGITFFIAAVGAFLICEHILFPKVYGRPSWQPHAQGRPPFFVGDNYGIDVRNLAASRDWYKEKLGLREDHVRREDDSGRRFVDLKIGNDIICVSLVELPSDVSARDQHVIFFTKNIEMAHRWLAERGVLVEPIENDSGGNRFFQFHDLEGNKIEMCVEPR
jgi:catechol 2,3-dioxygenase-like lactoylglutathione lyase family enzyme